MSVKKSVILKMIDQFLLKICQKKFDLLLSDPV